jgi:hypothetical protein
VAASGGGPEMYAAAASPMVPFCPAIPNFPWRASSVLRCWPLRALPEAPFAPKKYEVLHNSPPKRPEAERAADHSPAALSLYVVHFRYLAVTISGVSGGGFVSAGPQERQVWTQRLILRKMLRDLEGELTTSRRAS